MILIYEWILIPIAMLVLPLVAVFSSKIRLGLQLRKKDRSSSKSLEDCVWIHVASGEWEYAKPVARKLKAQGEKILVTHFSPSVRKSLEASPDVDTVYALPIDNRLLFEDFFRRFKPRLLLVARTDMWPVFLRETKKRKIKTVLFSARLSDESLLSRSRIASYFSKLSLSLFDKIFCVTDQDQKNLNQVLGFSKTKVLGDTRYDQVLHRLKNPKALRDIFNPNFKYFVGGSIWSADEDILLPIIKEAQQNLPLRFVLVPHEPTTAHISKLKEKLKTSGIEACEYSKISSSDWAQNSQNVLLVDEVGILAEIYLSAQFALVGNSFEKNLVHSVMEPLAAGTLTFVGPFHKNNREAIEFSSITLSSGYKAVEVISSGEVLLQKLKGLFQKDTALLKKEIIYEVQSRTGASDKLIHEIEAMDQRPVLF